LNLQIAYSLLAAYLPPAHIYKMLLQRIIALERAISKPVTCDTAKYYCAYIRELAYLRACYMCDQAANECNFEISTIHSLYQTRDFILDSVRKMNAVDKNLRLAPESDHAHITRAKYLSDNINLLTNAYVLDFVLNSEHYKTIIKN
jgi:hypothetical protein